MHTRAPAEVGHQAPAKYGNHQQAHQSNVGLRLWSQSHRKNECQQHGRRLWEDGRGGGVTSSPHDG